MTIPIFTTLIDALAWWRSHDRAELRAAIEPPVSRLGDDAYDASLARRPSTLTRRSSSGVLP